MDFSQIPDIPLETILSYLSAHDLIAFSLTCKDLYHVSSNDTLWKELCWMDWPWFFYNGKCESTLVPMIYQRSGNLYMEPPSSLEEILIQATKKSISLDGIPVCEGDLGARCRYHHGITDHEKHPLLSSKEFKYRNAYLSILNGKWSGILQVLNSLANREMSAFNALATFDKKKRAFHLCYHPSILARYRRGEHILLNDKSDNHFVNIIDETISISERYRFRRLPEELISFDARELYARQLFDLETEDGKLDFAPGDEVEIQWRFNSRHAWAWWRGIVSDLRTDDEDGEGILVVFPHYPPSCPWYAVVVSTLGIALPNPPQNGQLGFVGGIRKVGCLSHIALWKRNFEMVGWAMELHLRDQLNEMEQDQNEVDAV